MLTKFKELFLRSRQVREFTLLFIVCILFLGYSFFTSRHPTTSLPPVTTPKQGQAALLQNTKITITFDPKFSPPNIPDSLPVYSYQPTKINLMQIAAALANKYLKDPVVPISGIWNAKDNSATVSVSPDPPYLHYAVNYLSSTTLFRGPKLPTTAGAITATRNFLDFIGNIPEITPMHTSYLTVDGPHFETGSPSHYEIINTEFATSISGVPIYDPDFYLSGPISSHVGQNNTLVRINIYENLLTPNTKGKTYPLFNQKTIIEHIRQSQIISIDNYPEPLTEFDKVSEIIITSIEVIYFPDKNKQLLIPAFKIIAQTISSTGQENQTKILLPANNELFPIKP